MAKVSVSLTISHGIVGIGLYHRIITEWQILSQNTKFLRTEGERSVHVSFGVLNLLIAEDDALEESNGLIIFFGCGKREKIFWLRSLSLLLRSLSLQSI